jgi:hypothetical protein
MVVITVVDKWMVVLVLAGKIVVLEARCGTRSMAMVMIPLPDTTSRLRPC